MKRKQFPLSLAWAATIHKYQGQSVDVLAIGGYEGKFWPGSMFYTALSRCRRAGGVFLPGFRPTCIKANRGGLKEIESIRNESMISLSHKRLDFFL